MRSAVDVRMPNLLACRVPWSGSHPAASSMARRLSMSLVMLELRRCSRRFRSARRRSTSSTTCQHTGIQGGPNA